MHANPSEVVVLPNDTLNLCDQFLSGGYAETRGVMREAPSFFDRYLGSGLPTLVSERAFQQRRLPGAETKRIPETMEDILHVLESQDLSLEFAILAVKSGLENSHPAYQYRAVGDGDVKIPQIVRRKIPNIEYPENDYRRKYVTVKEMMPDDERLRLLLRLKALQSASRTKEILSRSELENFPQAESITWTREYLTERITTILRLEENLNTQVVSPSSPQERK